MKPLEWAKTLVGLNMGELWPQRLLHAMTSLCKAEWREAVVARAAELVTAGESVEVAELAAMLEARARHLLPPELVEQLEGPPEWQLERERLHAELASEREQAVRWWCEEYPLLCGIRGVEPTLDEVPEFAQEVCRTAWNAPSPAATISNAVSALFEVVKRHGGEASAELAPLSDWSEAEIRHDWRGMTATEKRIYRAAFDLAKPNETEPGQAARYAHRKVIDYRVERAEAAVQEIDGRSAA